MVDELPGLVTSLGERLGPIVMVGYHRHGWEDTPPLVEIAGHTVELLGFSSDEPATLILIGQDGNHLTLRVIPPEASEARVSDDVDVAAASRSLVGRSLADIAEELARHEGRGDEQRTAQIRPQITQWCDGAAQQFVDAPLQTFVSILVEHLVRNRLLSSRAAKPHRGAVLKPTPT